MTDETRNGHLVDVAWPDYTGKVGFQPHSTPATVSYRSSGRDLPKVGDKRLIGEHGEFEVTKVGKNPFVPGMTTLELKPAT